MLEKINKAASYLADNGYNNAELGIILGTGLGGLVKDVKIEKSIEYKDIPHFPEATVESHSGMLIWES